MSPDKLVHMANQIAAYFRTQPHDPADKNFADHINKFWEPRMRAQLLSIMDEEGGRGLDEIALKAKPLIRKPAYTLNA